MQIASLMRYDTEPTRFVSLSEPTHSTNAFRIASLVFRIASHREKIRNASLSMMRNVSLTDALGNSKSNASHHAARRSRASSSGYEVESIARYSTKYAKAMSLLNESAELESSYLPDIPEHVGQRCDVKDTSIERGHQGLRRTRERQAIVRGVTR